MQNIVVKRFVHPVDTINLATARMMMIVVVVQTAAAAVAAAVEGEQSLWYPP